MESTKSSDVTYYLHSWEETTVGLDLLHFCIHFLRYHTMLDKKPYASHILIFEWIFIMSSNTVQTKEVTISADTTTCQHIRLGAMLSQVYAQFTTSFCVIYFTHNQFQIPASRLYYKWHLLLIATLSLLANQAISQAIILNINYPC